MIQEQPSKTWIVVITTIISTAGVVCVAIVGLGLPFMQEYAKQYFATSTPYVIVVTPTQANSAVVPEPLVQPVYTAGVSQPTPEQVVVIPTSAPSVLPPSLPEGYISIGKYYSGMVNSGGTAGNQVYSHFITGKIKYTRVTADDDIDKIELVCTDNIMDITAKFYPIPIPEGELFPHYASEVLEIPTNCRVDFYVVDTVGVATGITVNAEIAP